MVTLLFNLAYIIYRQLKFDASESSFCISFLPGSHLQGVKYRHPLTNENLPFFSGSHVTSNKGTGLVHTAPAHGHDDFQLAKNLGIQIVSTWNHQNIRKFFKRLQYQKAL